MKSFAQNYLELLTTKFSGLNLTRIQSFSEFYEKQILDSISPIEFLESFNTIVGEVELIADIGFGGGFPILPLAHQFPTKKLIGFEARKKKSQAVNEMARSLGLNNVKTFHERFENIVFDRKCLITFKAVSTIRELLKKISLTSDCYVLFYKGPGLDKLEPGYKEIDARHWQLIEEKDFKIGDNHRKLILYRSINLISCKTNESSKISSFF